LCFKDKEEAIFVPFPYLFDLTKQCEFLKIISDIFQEKNTHLLK